MTLRGSKCVVFRWVTISPIAGVFCGSITEMEMMQGSYLRYVACNISSIKKQIPNRLNGNGDTRYANEFTCNGRGEHNFTFSPRTTKELLRKYVQR